MMVIEVPKEEIFLKKRKIHLKKWRKRTQKLGKKIITKSLKECKEIHDKIQTGEENYSMKIKIEPTKNGGDSRNEKFG